MFAPAGEMRVADFGLYISWYNQRRRYFFLYSASCAPFTSHPAPRVAAYHTRSSYLLGFRAFLERRVAHCNFHGRGFYHKNRKRDTSRLHGRRISLREGRVFKFILLMRGRALGFRNTAAVAVSFKATHVRHFGDNNRSSQTTSRQEKLHLWKTAKHSRMAHHSGS